MITRPDSLILSRASFLPQDVKRGKARNNIVSKIHSHFLLLFFLLFRYFMTCVLFPEIARHLLRDSSSENDTGGYSARNTWTIQGRKPVPCFVIVTGGFFQSAACQKRCKGVKYPLFNGSTDGAAYKEKKKERSWGLSKASFSTFAVSG